MVDLSTLRPDPDNANEGDVDSVIESIEVNGYINPMIARADNGMIVAGHTRYAALMELGETRGPVLFMDTDENGALRYQVGDNQTARRARLNPTLQLEILKRLQHTDDGLLGTGYDEILMQDLMLQKERDAEQEFYSGAFNHETTVYQVIVEFEDENDAIDLEAELADRELNVRRLNL